MKSLFRNPNREARQTMECLSADALFTEFVAALSEANCAHKANFNSLVHGGELLCKFHCANLSLMKAFDAALGSAQAIQEGLHYVWWLTAKFEAGTLTWFLSCPDVRLNPARDTFDYQPQKLSADVALLSRQLLWSVKLDARK